jgi:integrase
LVQLTVQLAAMTRRKKVPKPDKPYPEFPLSPHPSGQWCKRIQGTLHYFGSWDDPQAALDKYLEERDYLHAGTTPPVQRRTVADLLNEFLGIKKQALDLGEMTDSSWQEIVRVTDAIAGHFGKNRPLEHLGNLTGLRAALAKGTTGTLGPAALKRRLTIARSVFKFGGIDTRGELKPPPARILRQAKQEAGERWYRADDLRKVVDAADEPLRSAILLGLSCAFGPQDICTLTAKSIDGEFIQHPRPKTAIMRTAWRWPEVKTLPPFPENWSRFTIARDFDAASVAAAVENFGFYSLRRTAQTVLSAADVNQATIDAIFGWSRQDMAAIYRQRVFRSRVQAAGEFLRDWYLAKISIS